MSAEDALRPFLQGSLQDFKGLEELSVEELRAILGSSKPAVTVSLGFHPALRHTFVADVPSGGLHAYERDARIVLVESLRVPPGLALDGLPPVTEILPHELLIEGRYAHEYLYAPKGLIVTLAVALEGGAPDSIVRYRGTRPLRSADDFGPEFYKPFEDQTYWPSP